MKGCFPPLSEYMRLQLEAYFSFDETSKALRGMGSMKAPGPDGY